MVSCVNHGWVRWDIPKEYFFLGGKGFDGGLRLIGLKWRVRIKNMCLIEWRVMVVSLKV